MAKDDALRVLKPILDQYPDLTEAEIQELYQGIMEMGTIAYERTQAGKIFITDDPNRTH